MGRLGFGFGGLTRSATGPGSANPPPPQAVLSSFGADGWQATVANPDDLSFAPVALVRAGFDNAGAPVSWPQDVLLTKRVRKPYPNQSEFTADRVALSDYVYATDSANGVANESAEFSPLPIAAWVMPSCEVVADSVNWEVVAFHRDARPDPATGIGKQVACVRVRASNGSESSAWQAVHQTIISDLCDDGCPLEAFAGSLDISGLSEGLFWLEAEVFPWFGAGASVLRSEDKSDPREFARRYFLKDIARTVSPPLVYVASTGNNTSGTVSSDPAIAAANPCLTVGGALARARSQLGATQGSIDGLRIRILDGVSMGAVPYQADYPQDVGAIIVERAPGVSRSSAAIDWTANLRFYFKTHTAPNFEGAVTFRDVTINRGAATTIYGEATNKLLLQFHNVSFANNGYTGTMRANSNLAVFGMAMTGYAGAFSYTTSSQVRILRGLVADLNNAGPEAWVTAACKLTRANGCFYADPAKGAIFASNSYIAPSANTGPLVFTGAVSGGDIGPLAVVQNLVEVTHTEISAASVRLSADDDLGDITHAVIMHNTTIGTEQLGRWNVFYDEHPSVGRDHRLIACKGNIVAQLNTKGDIFQMDSTRLGNFAFSHGVGCSGNYTVFDANAPDSEHQDYPGEGSLIGAGDPDYADYRGTTGGSSTPVAGAGGGDYRLSPGSAARAILAGPVMAFDMDGVARGSGQQAAGAYV